MAMSADLPFVETRSVWDPMAELDRLTVLPPRSDSAAFLAWIGRLRTFTHDDLPTIVGADPALFALALSLAGPGFPWNRGEGVADLLKEVDLESLSNRLNAARPGIDRCLESRSIDRLSRIQLMTALVARELAREPGIVEHPNPFGCYVLGMTHRLGEVAVLSVVQARDTGSDARLPEAACGSPAEIAARLAARWGFPPSLVGCFQARAARGRVPEGARAEMDVLRFAEEIVRGLPSLGRPGAATPTAVAGARRPARLRLSKDRLEAIVWAAYAEAASLARTLHPWAE